jgi:hypothetical protein
MCPSEASTESILGEFRADTITAQTEATRMLDPEASHEPDAHSSVTPSKRKAMSFDSAPTSGKQKRANEDARATASPSPGRPSGALSGRTLAISKFFRAPLAESTRHGQREGTCDNDRTRVPPHRSGIIHSETVVDANEVMTEAQSRSNHLFHRRSVVSNQFSDVQATNDAENLYQPQSSMACTQYNPNGKTLSSRTHNKWAKLLNKTHPERDSAPSRPNPKASYTNNQCQLPTLTYQN